MIINTKAEYDAAIIDANSFLDALERAFKKHKEEEFLRNIPMDFFIIADEIYADFYVVFHVSENLAIRVQPVYQHAETFFIDNISPYICARYDDGFTRDDKCFDHIADYFSFLCECNNYNCLKHYEPRSLEDEIIEINLKSKVVKPLSTLDT